MTMTSEADYTQENEEQLDVDAELAVIAQGEEDQENAVTTVNPSFFDMKEVEHHPILEKIVDMLVTKTQNTDRKFFRVIAAYFLAKIAASMRAKVFTKDRGEIPLNIYALALAPSGSGKGFSVNLLENDFFGGFQQRFMEETFPLVAEQHIWEVALKRAARNGTQDQEEYDKAEKEFRQTGALAFTFDSGTPAAVKQMRHKLLMAKIGSINFQVDEIGSNLNSTQVMEVLNLFLELYDQGQIKQKLTKNTAENQRGEELQGKSPANFLGFGTPSKLLDGGPTEDAFYSLLDTGYARRLFFAFGHRIRAAHSQTAAEIYAKLIEPTDKKAMDAIYHHFVNLADPSKYNWTIEVPDEVAIRLLEYKIECERIADNLPEHEEIKKAELSHRYFKALKLAGTYAYVDEELILSMENLHASIKLVEESGEAFQELLNRDKTYVKLAKYLAAEGTEQTHADLHEALPFYKSGTGARNEMMTLATAWGYRQHIIIKKTFVDGIEFFKGETLEETDLNKIKVSYSDHFAYNYLNEEVPFDSLDQLFTAPGYNWCNHYVQNGHRSEKTMVNGFNMIGLDVDEGTPLFMAHDLMKEYSFMTYTTKRHTDLDHRYRIIFPINYNLNLDTEEYEQFIANLLTWLPFKVDESANQRSRKWLTNPNALIHKNEGKLLDALKFVPKTQKNEQYLQQYQSIESLDNLERWFAQRIAVGNRNNQMHNYAMALYDSGFSFSDIEKKVLFFNNQLSNKLSEDELRITVLASVAKKFQKA